MMEKEKIVCIIQSRQGSTRLPGKSLMPLWKDMPVLELCVRGVQCVNFIKPGSVDTIVVATTTEKEDDSIEKWCLDHKITCFRGSSKNVLDRYYQCAKACGADWILRITADCPLIDPYMILGLIKQTPRKPYQALGFNLGKIPAGWDTELFSFEILKKEWESGKHKEHVTTGMRSKFEDNLDYGTDFRFKGVQGLEVNTSLDYEFLKEYMKVRYGS